MDVGGALFMRRLPLIRVLVTLSSVVLTSTAAAAPQPLITYFLPMPVPAGGLSKTVWGASAVGPRDPANGIEDNGASGGVSTGSETNFYWDGKILKGSDGKYHLYGVHWKYSIGFGPPSGGSTGWKISTPMQSVSDNLLGPYIYQSDITPKGHNVTALVQPDSTYAGVDRQLPQWSVDFARQLLYGYQRAQQLRRSQLQCNLHAGSGQSILGHLARRLYDEQR